jgi:hypothetical protein
MGYKSARSGEAGTDDRNGRLRDGTDDLTQAPVEGDRLLNATSLTTFSSSNGN